tara:strand:+ start:2454 stop:3110 length:657 start_codon:yes stop_codon:yes gene_type:complete
MSIPEIVYMAADALQSDPLLWSRTMNQVAGSDPSNLRLPESSIRHVQPTLRSELKTNFRISSNTSSAQLSNVFMKRVNNFFGVELLKNQDDVYNFMVRVGCVLLKMQRLNKKSELGRLVCSTGCATLTKRNSVNNKPTRYSTSNNAPRSLTSNNSPIYNNSLNESPRKNNSPRNKNSPRNSKSPRNKNSPRNSKSPRNNSLRYESKNSVTNYSRNKKS